MENNKSWLPVAATPEVASGNQRNLCYIIVGLYPMYQNKNFRISLS